MNTSKCYLAWWMPALVAAITLFPCASRADIAGLEKDFLTPPDDARPMVRWWWFGPAVTHEGIERELKAMKAGGFGGVEVQPTYPLALDSAGDAPGGAASAVKNLKFMSPEFLEMLGFTAAKCKELGLRMDLTIGSGWPYGGPSVTTADAAKQLEPVFIQSLPGQKIVSPGLPAGRVLFAAFAAPPNAPTSRGRGAANIDLSAYKPVSTEKDGTISIPADLVAAGAQVLCFAYRQNIMQVKRPAYGADGPVLDHLNHDDVERFIKDVAEPEINACGGNPPYAIFCDSLEVNNENWTDTFLAEFQKRRGYDLSPYLPALVGNIGDKTDDVRHDYGLTVTELFNENFSGQLQALAKKYGSRFRMQGYGSPAATLSSYANADLPEGELQQDFDFHQFRATRYAASASHLLGQKVTSSEAFTWLHGAPFRATPLDIKGEVDQHFLDGINQIVCHGWPYTVNGMPYPGDSFYAAAVFDDQNPWYIAMPDITTYIARTSEILRQGTPVNDVAIYLPEGDLYAAAGSSFNSMNAAWSNESGVLAGVLNSGNNADAVDDALLARGKVDSGTLAVGDMHYRTVILPNIERMPLATAHMLDKFAKGGGVVLALGRQPSRVPGLNATEQDQTDLAAIMARLFKGKGAAGVTVASTEQLATALATYMGSDVALVPPTPAIGVVHRRMADGDIYFFANTSNVPQQTTAHVPGTRRFPEIWNPLNGKRMAGMVTDNIPLELPPYGSEIIVSVGRQPAPASGPLPPRLQPLDISADWSVSFKGQGPEKTVNMKELTSWTDLDGMKNFSGVASYQKTIAVTAQQAAVPLAITFGTGTAIAAAGGRGTMGYAAELDSPVHDAAVVYVNGERIGAAWCAPFAVDLDAGKLKEGENTLRIDVANTAVNYLSNAGFPNYDLPALRRIYGNRFDPQGMQLYAQPLPSGLQGPIKIEAVSR